MIRHRWTRPTGTAVCVNCGAIRSVTIPAGWHRAITTYNSRIHSYNNVEVITDHAPACSAEALLLAKILKERAILVGPTRGAVAALLLDAANHRSACVASRNPGQRPNISMKQRIERGRASLLLARDLRLAVQDLP